MTPRRQSVIALMCASLLNTVFNASLAQAQSPAAQAHAQGLATGQANNTAVRGGITTQAASQVVPGYGTPAPQTQLYGQGDLRANARGQLAACATQPPQQRDPVCAALLGAQTSAQTPRPGLSANDPAVLAARRIQDNPRMSLGDMSRLYSSCRVQQATTPSTEQRACRRVLLADGATSAASAGNHTTLSCSRRLRVSVQRQLNCTPGQWSAQAQGSGHELAAQCRPEPLPQRLRLSGLGYAPQFFDLNLDQALTAPRALVRLATGEQLWLFEQRCAGDACTLRMLIEPRDLCSERINSDSECTAAPSPFTANASGFGLSSQGATYPQLSLSLTRHHEHITTTDSWEDECAGMGLETGRCQRAGPEVCAEGPGGRSVDGINLTRSCWRFETPLRCDTSAPAGATPNADTAPDDCLALQRNGCTLNSQTCLQTYPDGRCRLQESRYTCPTPSTTQTQVSDCPTGEFCVGESCFNTRYANDADFPRTMSLMEAAREAGMYLDTDRMEVFQGEANRCRNRLLTNCCSTDSAGADMSNQRVFGLGSKLVFDILMNAQNRAFVYAGISALLTGSAFQGTFTTYGVSVSFNGAVMQEGLSIVYMGDTVWIAYDPWTLAIVVIFLVVMAATSCDEEEGRLALKEGARLCHTVGSYCSTCLRVLGRCVSCITRTSGKCCFNSMLSRIVNEQGRGQIGKSWGSAETPDCSGFTVGQLQQLNFAAMDLSEFYASIMAALPPTTDAVNAPGVERARRCVAQGGCP